MKQINEYIKESKKNESKDTAVFSLSFNDLDRILFSLSFTSGWSSIIHSDEMKKYEKLWNELKEAGKKAFNNEDFVEDWRDYELAHTGSFKH